MGIMKRDRAKTDRKQDVCDCLSWKKAYIHNRILCGSGFEGFTPPSEQKKNRKHDSNLTKKEEKAKEITKNQYCNAVYMNIDESFCVNKNMDANQGQWCYVRGGCQKLAPDGFRVSGYDNTYTTSVKICQ